MCFGPLCNRSDRKVRQERKERDRAINSKNKIEEIGTDIGFLHQLQNAVFDATGEELNVNELLKE